MALMMGWDEMSWNGFMSTLCVQNFTTFFVCVFSWHLLCWQLSIFFYFFFGSWFMSDFPSCGVHHHTYILQIAKAIYIHKKLHAAIGSVALSLSLPYLRYSLFLVLFFFFF